MQASSSRRCGAGSRAWAPERRPAPARQRPRLRVAAKAEDAASNTNGKQSSGCSSGGGGCGSGAASAHSTSSSGGCGNGTLTAQRPQSIDLAAKQSVDLADCEATCATKQRARQRTAVQWPQKSELYLLRSDGHSCTRETVQRECGCGMIEREARETCMRGSQGHQCFGNCALGTAFWARLPLCLWQLLY